MRKTFDWLVTAYDKNDKVIEAFVIEDRTEFEANTEVANKFTTCNFKPIRKT